jgi:hypothetical protein
VPASSLNDCNKIDDDNNEELINFHLGLINHCPRNVYVGRAE